MGYDELVRKVGAAMAIATRHPQQGIDLMHRLWADVEQGSPAAVIVAHYMADLQVDRAVELEWDLRALEASMHCIEGELQIGDVRLRVREFLPSLHLNLADDQLRAGNRRAAMEHARQARHLSAGLPPGAYEEIISSALAALEARLESGAAS